MSTSFHLSTIVTAGAGTGNGPGATPGVSTPAVASIAAPASAPRSSSQPAGGDARQRPPAGTNAQQHARNAAAEVAYPREKYGAKTARSWPKPLVVIVGGNEGPDLSWNDGTGHCRHADPELFFPERGDQNKSAAQAKAICAGCPLLQPCREHGIKHEMYFGVWGGLSVMERRDWRNGRAS